MSALTRNLVVASLLLPVAAIAQSRPDFSGTWTQVEPAPGRDATHVERLELRDSVLKVTVQMSGSAIGGGYAGRFDHTYTIGAPAEATKDKNGVIRSVAVTWEGPTLVFVRTTQEGANTTTERDVWSLSEDGTKLTKSSETTSWKGTSRDTRVLKRQ